MFYVSPSRGSNRSSTTGCVNVQSSWNSETTLRRHVWSATQETNRTFAQKGSGGWHWSEAWCRSQSPIIPQLWRPSPPVHLHASRSPTRCKMCDYATHRISSIGSHKTPFPDSIARLHRGPSSAHGMESGGGSKRPQADVAPGIFKQCIVVFRFAEKTGCFAAK